MSADGWKEYEGTCLEKDGDAKSKDTTLPILSREFRVGPAFQRLWNQLLSDFLNAHYILVTKFCFVWIASEQV